MATQHNPAFLALVDAARSQIRECTIEDLVARQTHGEDFHLVDVREAAEWQNGYIPGAIHVSKGIIERDIETILPNKNEDIVLYCGGGYRSALAAVALQQMGYSNVVSMDGGWRAWKESGNPTAQP